MRLTLFILLSCCTLRAADVLTWDDNNNPPCDSFRIYRDNTLLGSVTNKFWSLAASGSYRVMGVRGTNESLLSEPLTYVKSTALRPPANLRLLSSFVNGSFTLETLGWQVSGNLAWAADRQAIVFNSGQRPPNGVLTQVFATEPGQSYRFSFVIFASPPGAELKMRASVTGDEGKMLWSQEATVNDITVTSGDFLTNGYVTTVRFQDVSEVTENVDLVLDDVKLN